MDYVLFEASFHESFIPEVTKEEQSLDHTKLMNSIKRCLIQVMTERDGLEDGEGKDPVERAIRVLTLFTHFYDYYKLKGGKYLNDKQAKLKPTLDLKILSLLNSYEIALPIKWPYVGKKEHIVIGVSYLASRFLNNKEVDEIITETMLKREKERNLGSTTRD